MAAINSGIKQQLFWCFRTCHGNSNLLADALVLGGHRLEFQGVVNLAYPVAERVIPAVENWTSQNWGPIGAVRQYSSDAALS